MKDELFLILYILEHWLVTTFNEISLAFFSETIHPMQKNKSIDGFALTQFHSYSLKWCIDDLIEKIYLSRSDYLVPWKHSQYIVIVKTHLGVPIV